jgi:hypothetical protein
MDRPRSIEALTVRASTLLDAPHTIAGGVSSDLKNVRAVISLATRGDGEPCGCRSTGCTSGCFRAGNRRLLGSKRRHPTANNIRKGGGRSPPTFSSGFCGGRAPFRPQQIGDFRPGSIVEQPKVSEYLGLPGSTPVRAKCPGSTRGMYLLIPGCTRFSRGVLGQTLVAPLYRVARTKAGRRADSDVFPTRIRPKSGPKIVLSTARRKFLQAAGRGNLGGNAGSLVASATGGRSRSPSPKRPYPMLRNTASGPEIGLPGWIPAVF